MVTGTVYNIDKTFFLGTAYVNLMAGYVADGVTAYFSSEGKSQITNVSQGQTITVLGKMFRTKSWKCNFKRLCFGKLNKFW